MILKFTGGGYWDGVQFKATHAPQEIRLGGVFIHDHEDQENLPPAMRKTVLMSKYETQQYEFEKFEDPEEETAVYRFKQ